MLTSSREGLQRQEDHFGSKQRHDTDGYNIIPLGYCTYRNRSDDGRFAFNINTISSKAIVSKFYPVFRFVNANSLFMSEFLNSSPRAKKRLAVLAVGTSQVVLSFEALKAVKLDLPCCDEQDKIASFLECLNRRIEHQRKLITALKKYKRGLLRSYFMTDEWNTHSKWDKCKLGPCCSKIGSGKTPRGGSSVYVDHGVMFLRSQNVLWGTLDLNDVSYIDEETNNSMLSSEVRCGDVLLNITGASIGRSCIYSLDERANVNQHVCILRLSQEGKERLLPEFLLQQILSDRIQQQVMDCQNGGSREGLNFQQISDFNIVVPDMREQRKICGMLNAFDQRVSCEETALHTLLDLRAALMQQLFI
ncbi:restriction endonuclease subunit S [Oscillibacter sp. PC13]|uniref:restriction endonuclease subunit S n=1 Tax=Oscillibacter sp. PC13 TaxID=1855299 RepID=UPI00241C8F7F|nr:restriction endonuclease subunit S [Oscillibacter sp. PC13]